MSPRGKTALVLTGGGARAAYQVGLLRCLAKVMPETRIPLITGTSAGAINAVFLAAHPGSMREAAAELSELWTHLTADKVFKVGSGPLWKNVLRWGAQLVSGGSPAPTARSLLDTKPLARHLRSTLRCVDDDIPGIAANVERGRLEALALTTLRYATQQTVTWIQGRGDAGSRLETWRRPTRMGVAARITVRHVMASAALPLAFPAVRIGDFWYGDGGVRMLNPLGPAVHLGADRIVAISTRYRRTLEEASQPELTGYPPIAQVAGSLMNAVFLDALDHDAHHLQRVNRLLARAPGPDERGLRHIDLLVLRPSEDLGKLAADFEPRLPGAFRFLTRGLGTRETKSPDFLSLLMFQPDYLQRLMEIGERDAEARREELHRIFGGG